MRIRRIKVRNFAGIDEAEVSFPDTGITIIEGENEIGKTSMIKAVDAILAYLDSSSARPIKDAMTVGTDLGPEVEVDITAGEYEFTYRKRWLRNTETVLEVSAPQHEQLSGREAHDRVDQILEEAVDLDLWKALRLDQGTGLSQAKFEVSALGRALDAAAGGDVAGDREDALFDRIEAEYLNLWTAGGKPRGDLRDLESDLEAAQEASNEANAHLQALDDDAEEIQRLERAAVSIRQTHEDASKGVEELAEQVEEVEKAREAAERSKGESERAQAVHSSARSDRERRDELIAAVKTATDDLTDAEQELAKSVPGRELMRAEQTATSKALKAVRSVFEERRRVYELARDDREYHRQLIEIEQFTERRDRVNGAEELLSLAEESLESIKIDAELLGKIEKAHLDLAEAKAVAARSRPTVDVKALNAIALNVDGTDIEMDANDERSILVSGETHIVIVDVAEVLVRAGEDDGNALGQAERAQERYDELCRRGGVRDFSNAREQADARAQAERDQSDALKTIKQDLRDLTPDGLSGKVDRLTSRTSRYLQDREPKPPVPEDFDEAKKIERKAKRSAAKAEDELSNADAAAQGATADLNRLDVDAASRQTRVEISESTLSSAEKTLAEARSEKSDKNLRKSEADALAAAEGAEVEAVEAQDRLGGTDAESVDARLSNAEAVLKRCSDDLRENEDRRRELRIKLSVETERGPAQYADEAASLLMEISRKYDRLESKAAATRLLQGVFKEHRNTARQRYNQPFRDRIESLGRIVYGPNFEVLLSDDLSIARRTLDDTTLDFGQLSTGAQEQLGLLARLACATLVADEGGVPVIFDDALGWTDPGRLERMGAAISTAAEDCQIIILTCVPDRYSAVGKASTVTLS
ncbi:MAG: AAA family ATPase [Actinomycetota bacterium]|nr:AAA family ATPase [Actinomycetota bacterium]